MSQEPKFEPIVTVFFSEQTESPPVMTEVLHPNDNSGGDDQAFFLDWQPVSRRISPDSEQTAPEQQTADPYVHPSYRLDALHATDRFNRLVGLAYEEVDEPANENDFFSQYRSTDQSQQRWCAAAVAGITVLTLSVFGIMSIARHNAAEQEALQAEQARMQENVPAQQPTAIASVPHSVARHKVKHHRSMHASNLIARR